GEPGLPESPALLAKKPRLERRSCRLEARGVRPVPSEELHHVKSGGPLGGPADAALGQRERDRAQPLPERAGAEGFRPRERANLPVRRAVLAREGAQILTLADRFRQLLGPGLRLVECPLPSDRPQHVRAGLVEWQETRRLDADEPKDDECPGH